MDPDYTALASRIAARAEVLGCLILSRDGLVLGAFPPGGEHDVTPAWLRFAEVGDPRRGVVVFDDQVWAYASTDQYAAFAVASPTTRPGILIEYLEQVLVAAGETRSHLIAVSAPERVDLVSGGFRGGPPLPGRRPKPPPSDEPREGEFADELPPWDDEPAPVETQDAEADQGPGAVRGDPEEAVGSSDAPAHEAAPDEDEPPRRAHGHEEVDRVALSREFANLQEHADEPDQDSPGRHRPS